MENDNKTVDVSGGLRDVRLIRKANELVEARYRYDIWETRIFAQVVSMVRPDDQDFQEYKIYLNDVIKTFDIDGGGKAYRLLVQGAKGLVNKKLFIERERDGQPTELETWLLTSAEYFKSQYGQGSYITVTFHPALRPYLLELKNRYLVYDIRNILQLTSVYSIRIYELLKQYEKIGKRTFEVDHMKLILGILPNEYKLYGHFKDKVILKAQSDLVAETDISFDFQEHKRGRKVVALTFFIYANERRHVERAATVARPFTQTPTDSAQEKTQILKSPFFAETFREVSGWGVTETRLFELFAEHGETKVREGLQCTRDFLKKGKNFDSIAGFFIKAVQEGWKSAGQISRHQTVVVQQKREAEAAARAAEIKKWQEILENLTEKRRLAAREIVRQLTHDDPQLAENAVQCILAESFTKTMLENATGLQLDTLQLDDWRIEPVLRDAVIRQIENMQPEHFRQVQANFDDSIRVARRMLNELNR